MTTKRPRKPKAEPEPPPLDPTCVVSVGSPILPVGVQFSVEVPFSMADEATVKLVELARLVEPHLKLQEHELPQAEHVPSAGPVEVGDDDAYESRRRPRKRRRVGFKADDT